MMVDISIDFETRSLANLPQVGAYRYAEDPSTDVWCMAYKVGGEEEVRLWVPGDPYPFWDGAGIALFAWNAGFERNIWNQVMVRRYGWPVMPLSVWNDTAAAAATLALPRSLEGAAKVLLTEEKDMAGNRLSIQMAKPRRTALDGTPVWWDDPKKLQALYAYCKQDVVVESKIRDIVWPLFTKQEQTVWRMDQEINDHGVLIDVDSVVGALLLAEEEVGELSQQISDATGGDVPAVTDAGALLRWVTSQGVTTDTVSREWCEAALRSPAIPNHVKTAIRIRLDGAKSSTAKLVKFDAVASPRDNRARGLLMYHGADTGRWAGRLIQPQNLPRGEIRLDVDEPLLWELLRRRERETIRLLYGPPMTVVSAALRGLIIAPPGHDLIAVDYSSIEARVLAWLAGEQRMLGIFQTHGLVYEDMASRIFGVPLEEVTKLQRSHGKVGVLGCGYQMGAKTLRDYGSSMGVELGLEEAQSIVNGYRGLNPSTVALWASLQDAAMTAVEHPGQTFWAGERISLTVERGFLWMQLPSGRRLAYAKPVVRMRPLPWDLSEQRPAVRIWHVNSLTRKWSRRYLYGGLLAENATQAVARDVMVEGMGNLLLPPHIYRPILTVHDEVLCEVPEGRGSPEEMVELLTSPAPWMRGLPLAADGWRGKRYRKD